MRKDAQAVLLLLVGATLLKISITGTYVRYVKPGLLPLLVAAGLVLIAVAGVTLWGAIVTPRQARPDPDPPAEDERADDEREGAERAAGGPAHHARGGHRRGRPVLDRGAALDRTAFDRTGQRRDQADWDVFEQTGDMGRFVSLAMVHADDDGPAQTPAQAAAAPTQLMPTLTARPAEEPDPEPAVPAPAPARIPAQRGAAEPPGRTLARRGPALLAPRRADVDPVAPEDDDNHSHGQPRVGWLLLVPALALLMFAPPAIGSFQANRNGTALGSQATSDFPPLPAGDPLRITMLDYAGRAVYDAKTLDGRQIRLTGFIIAGPDGQPYLARMVVTCCAADARPIKIGLAGQVPLGLAQEQWVEVDGGYTERTDRDPINGEKIPYLQVTDVRVIPVPNLEYE